MTFPNPLYNKTISTLIYWYTSYFSNFFGTSDLWVNWHSLYES